MQILLPQDRATCRCGELEHDIELEITKLKKKHFPKKNYLERTRTMAATRALVVSSLSGLVIGGLAHESNASFGPGLLATATGMVAIPFAVEAGMSIMDRTKPHYGDTTDGIMGSILMGVVPAVIVGGLVALVSNKK